MHAPEHAGPLRWSQAAGRADRLQPGGQRRPVILAAHHQGGPFGAWERPEPLRPEGHGGGEIQRREALSQPALPGEQSHQAPPQQRVELAFIVGPARHRRRGLGPGALSAHQGGPQSSQARSFGGRELGLGLRLRLGRGCLGRGGRGWLGVGLRDGRDLEPGLGHQALSRRLEVMPERRAIVGGRAYHLGRQRLPRAHQGRIGPMLHRGEPSAREVHRGPGVGLHRPAPGL